MANLPSFDELPDHAPTAPTAPAAMSFDDLPHQVEEAPKASPPTSTATVPTMDFDSLPHQTPASDPQVASPKPVATPGVPPRQVSPVAQEYLQTHPATAFSLEASPTAGENLAKAGTVGVAQDISDRQREADSIKNSSLGFFNARIKQYYLDPQFLQLPKAQRDEIVKDQIDQWMEQGLPAGKLVPANPTAFTGVKGKFTLRDALHNYANDIETKGIANAPEVGGYYQNDKLATQQVPDATTTAALSFARGIPGLFGGNIGGEAGAALGEATGIPGGGIIGGVGGSIAGAFGAEDAVRAAADKYGGEDMRNGLESFDNLTNLGEQEHPLAAWMGRMGGQFAHNQLGFQELVRGKGLPAALAPRLVGGVIGGGVEAGSEAGRGDSLDPYKIGESALSGTVFTKPRYLGEGNVPMSFEGRNWTDTNTPKPELFAQVDSMLRNGSSPADILKLPQVPDTPENRRALRIVSADIRHGRDPGQSLENVQFRPDGLSVDRAVSAVNEHIKDWKDAPPVQVHDNYDSDTIPKDMQDKVGPGTLGWKDDNGEIHIIASQHADPAAISATMYHEGMHAGLVRAYQGGLDDKLVTLYDNANPRFRKALDAAWEEQSNTRHDWADLSEDQRKSLVADEVLASTSENGVHKKEFDTVSAFIRNFGRTHLGELGKRLSYSDAEVRQIMSTGYDAVSKGSGDALGPVRYMNFGVNAQSADLPSLDNYQKNGGVPDHPEYQQGWFKGPADHLPRYEVSDTPAAFKTDGEGGSPADRMREKNITLGDVLHHPALYEAYPHLRDIKFKGTDDTRFNGTWSPSDQTISLSTKAHDPMGTLLHEVQHAIQDHEGFARGANDRAVYRTAPLADIHKVIEERIETASARADKYAEEYQALQMAAKDKDWQALRQAHEQYKHLEEEGAEREAVRAAYENYQKLSKAKKEAMGIDNPYDSDFSDLKYKMAQSDHPVSWHLENARKDWERNTETVASLLKVKGDEWEARKAVRFDHEMSEKLYVRAGGEYEARATAERRQLTDDERLSEPQFNKTDREGVHPNEVYMPKDVLDTPSQEVAKSVNDEELPYQTPRVSRETLENPERGGRTKTIPNPDTIDWNKPIDTSTRFSRKYSGNFGKDYDSRQERTEDLVSGHFGSEVFKNVRGMMRPLEEYQGLKAEDITNAAKELQDQGFNAELAIAQGAIPDNAAYVVALKDLVREKLSAASEIAGRYRATGGMRHERELMRSVTELGQVMSVFDKTASNLGRMLYALNLRINEAPDAGLQRMLDSIRFANGKLDPVAMDKIAQALVSGDPTAIRKSIDRFDPKWKQYGQSLFYNFILGSKAVQLGNIMGNATHIVQKGLGDVLGYGVGLGQEGKFRLGDKLGLDVTAPDRMHSDELLARTSGLLAGLMNQETYNSHRAFNTMAKEFFVPAGSEAHENKFASQSIENLPLSLVLEYGTRGLQAADAFFRTVVEHSAMQGLATREARRLNNGETPTTEQIADVMANPTRELLTQVTGEADRITFQEHPFPIAEKFSKLMRSIPGGWLIAPIIRTPSNIGRTAFETFDPTGRITQRNRDALKAGGPEANRVRGGQLLATALWAGALYLMQDNMLNGGGPANPQARAQWLESHVPYTIGDTETGFFPLRGISPIGDGLSMIADMRDAYKFGKDPETGKADTALMVAAGMSDAYLSNSFLSSVTTGLERGVKPTIQNLLGTLVQSAASVPLLSQIKKEQDPFVRDTSNEGSIGISMADKASLMDNPGMEHYFSSIKPRDELPIRRDPFGQAIMAESPTSTDPVAQEVGRLVDSTGKAVVPSFSRVIKGAHVPNDLYNSFMAVSGPVMRIAVSQIMDDPVYKKTLNDEQRAALIRSNKSLKGLHERLNKQLQQMMLDRDPKFESKYISPDLGTLLTIPGENGNN